MEHKLIQGGEQWLPFARSRIKALRATERKYASQQFKMPDGALVRVKTVAAHDYISISGAEPPVLSGVTRDGLIIEVPGAGDAPPTYELQSFKPTVQAWRYILKQAINKTPIGFHNEDRLPVKIHPDLIPPGGSADDAQHKHLSPSMYSGLMAKAVQVILGYGVMYGDPGVGIQVPYDYRWARCHGITTDASGKKWIVEISELYGVRAMRLPVIKGTKGLTHSKQNVLKWTSFTFDGLPSGDPFVATDILALPSELTPIYSKTTFSTAMGWSFNDAGTEAHNTCYTITSGVATSYHYKLDISITDALKIATLSLVSSDVIETSPGFGYFGFYEPDLDVGGSPIIFNNLPGNKATITSDGGGGTARMAPLVACHINGVLDVVYLRNDTRARNTVVTDSGFDATLGGSASYLSNYYGNRAVCLISTGVPCDVDTPTRVIYRTRNLVDTIYRSETIGADFIERYDYIYRDFRSTLVTPEYGQAGIWPKGARDCYGLSGAGNPTVDGKGSSLISDVHDTTFAGYLNGVVSGSVTTDMVKTTTLTSSSFDAETLEDIKYFHINFAVSGGAIQRDYFGDSIIDRPSRPGVYFPTADGTTYRTWDYSYTAGFFGAGLSTATVIPPTINYMISPLTVKCSVWGTDPQAMFMVCPTYRSTYTTKYKFAGSMADTTPTDDFYSFLGYI